MKFKKFTLFFICIITLVFLQFTVVYADVGNSFSGNGNSSGSSGYNSSNASGYSSNYYNHNNYNTTHSGSGGELTWISFIVIVVLIIWGMVSAGGGTARHTYQAPRPSNDEPPKPTPVIENEMQVIENIQKVDPDFSEMKFKAYAKKVWLALQEAWETKNWNSVKQFESEELFELHNSQLQEYIKLKKTNCLDMQNIRNVTVTEFREDGTLEILVIRLYASLLDYIVDDTTNKIIEGSNQNYVYRNYRLEFIRPKGTKSTSQVQATHCPNCGAALNFSGTGECEYCHTTVSSQSSDWVLNLYAPW